MGKFVNFKFVGVKSFAKKIFLVVALALAVFSLGRRIWKNLEGARRVSTLKDDVRYLEGENKRLKDALSERTGLEFVEKEAREKLGMVKKGEKLVVLPNQESGGEEIAVADTLRGLPHWQEWLGVFGW